MISLFFVASFASLSSVGVKISNKNLERNQILHNVILTVTSDIIHAEDNVESYTKIQDDSDNDEGINITVDEAWEMLCSRDDGLQIPIDIRPYKMYRSRRITGDFEIRTILFPCYYYLFRNATHNLMFRIFNCIFRGKEVILYCNIGKASYKMAKLLVEDGFDGTVYNMAGGINEWIESGYPTVGKDT